MKDLKADLKYLSENPSITKLMELAEETINRAIAAELKVAHYQNEADGLNKQLYYLNESAKETINKLSAQVAGLREGLEKVRSAIIDYFPENTIRLKKFSFAAMLFDMANNCLSSPDPGAKYRAVVEAAEILLAELDLYDPAVYLNKRNGLRRALADLEGVKP